MADRTIDLNADLGEGMGDDEAMLDVVTSANVACGGHAGDVETMFRTMSAAARRGVVIGAHPSYPDPDGFGRRVLDLAHDAVAREVVAQIGTLRAVAALVPTEVAYVKLHGALANVAARDEAMAEAIADALVRYDSSLPVLAISGTVLARVAADRGIAVHDEIFADRAYLASGQLVPRDRPGAVLHEVDDVVDRIAGFLGDGRMPVVDGEPIELSADSICVHGDTAGAVAMARALRERLVGGGVELAPFAAA